MKSSIQFGRKNNHERREHINPTKLAVLG